jgi:hypothetical protein
MTPGSRQSTDQWYEVRMTVKLRASSEDEAINRGANLLQRTYRSGEGVFPAGTFDAQPCESPIRSERDGG